MQQTAKRVRARSPNIEVGEPFFDPENYGVHLTNSDADNTIGLQKVTDEASLIGGTVMFQKLYLAAGPVVGKPGVKWQGITPRNNGTKAPSGVSFTSGSFRLIDLRGIEGFEISNLTLSSLDAAYMGKFIDLATGTTTPSADFVMDKVIMNCLNCVVGIDLQNAIIANISRSRIGGGNIGISGLGAAQSATVFSNKVTIEDVTLVDYLIAAIESPGQNWTIRECTMENGAAGIGRALDCKFACYALIYAGNWHGDSTANDQVLVTLFGHGLSIYGCTFSAAGGTGVKAIKVRTGAIGLKIAGNYAAPAIATFFDADSVAVGFISGSIEGNSIESATPWANITAGTNLKRAGNNNAITPLSDQTEYIGVGTPEGVIAANIGAVFYRQDGGAGTSIYIKQSGAGTAGWVGK